MWVPRENRLLSKAQVSILEFFIKRFCGIFSKMTLRLFSRRAAKKR